MRGEYIIHNVPGDPPTTFYIADAPNLVDANIIWKCDYYEGVSVSENGLDGPFTTAVSEDLAIDILEERRHAIEMEDICRAAVDAHRPAAGRGPVPVDSGHSAGNGRGALSIVYRVCAIIMALLVVMLVGAWAEGLQSWGQALAIAGICSVVAYLMLRGAGDV